MKMPRHRNANHQFQVDVGSTSNNLLRQVRDKDAPAWEQLHEQYAPLIFSWCLLADMKPENAEDVVQEVMLSVLGAIGRFRKNSDRGSFRSWLRTITENKIHDHNRRAAKNAKAAGGSESLRRQHQIPEQQSRFHRITKAQAEAITILEASREEFSRSTWRAFFLVTFRDFTSAEAGEELGISSNAVRLAVGRVRRRLRDIITNLPGQQ